MTPDSKKCIRCGEIKPLAGFYKHPKMVGGYLGKCAECCRADARANRMKNYDRYLQYDRDRKDLPHRVEGRAKQIAKIRAEHPEKIRAHNAVSNAIRDGRLTKAPCVVCGDPNSHGHHEDYSKPLEVIWLCHTHHMERHRKD